MGVGLLKYQEWLIESQGRNRIEQAELTETPKAMPPGAHFFLPKRRFLFWALDSDLNIE